MFELYTGFTLFQVKCAYISFFNLNVDNISISLSDRSSLGFISRLVLGHAYLKNNSC